MLAVAEQREVAEREAGGRGVVSMVEVGGWGFSETEGRQRGGCEQHTYLQDQYLPKILLGEPAPAASLHKVEELAK